MTEYERLLADRPDGLVDTRLALHRLAAYVIAPVRYGVTGRFGLRAHPGGFGTPPFDDRVIRVDGSDLVDKRGEQDVRTTAISSLSAAAEFLGTEIDPETAAEHDSPELGDVGADLGVDAEASLFLGDWFSMAFEALETIRSDTESVDASPPQLWPGHFDPAIELGDDDHRSSFGASPGDGAIAEPYLYVSVWWPDRLGSVKDDPFWNADSFVGSVRRLSEFGDAPPVETAVDFWRESRRHLHG